ncbi:MAG TPA: hypothetical protein VHA82_04130 [Ramlibacter sp.]|uniref:hypothetical protein n=1 Tax=Ramlibacter sp. TaxID=1917967 RepID=UPI002CFFCFA4|nr:hypothetical protein [Ramlibacter sp.]HVZ42978.1 hypothetical protein [Ramlibacter sp.]
MRKTVEVDYSLWIAAPLKTVQSQFADLQHHIDANVHPKLRYELLAQEPRRARYRQEVKLLGMRQADLMDRRIDDDGSIHDESIDGFNKGAKIDFRFEPKLQSGQAGTEVHVKLRLQTPPFMGLLAPLLKKQVWKETDAAARQDKADIEGGHYRPSAALSAAMA